MEEFEQIYRDFIQKTFVESLYRPASGGDVEALTERMKFLSGALTTNNPGDITNLFRDLTTEAARAGVDISKIEGNQQVLQYLTQREASLRKTPIQRRVAYSGGEAKVVEGKPTTLYNASEEIKQSFSNIIMEVIKGTVFTSEEAFDKKLLLRKWQKTVSDRTGGLFNYKKYLELNPDVSEQYTQKYGGVSTEKSQEYFAHLHFLQQGQAEGRQYLVETPATEETLPTAPTPPSFRPIGGGGAGMDLSGLYSNLESSRNINQGLSSNVATLLNSFASQPDTPLPEVDVPEQAPPILQGDILQTIPQSRRLRGLTPYTGFQETGQTYLQSISQRGRQSTFNRQVV